MILNFEQIKELLPQRFPFLMLDRITEYEEDKRIVGIKNITGNEIFFQGHFPEEAIMPGALILEAMAQTAIIFFTFPKSHIAKNRKQFLFGTVKAKFLRPVVPGDILKIEITPIKVISSGGMVNAVATVDNELVAKAELSFSAKGTNG